MKNGTTKEVIAQFDVIAKLPDYWDHNQQYQKYLLDYIRNKKGIGLDIGCGTGELTNKLTHYCEKVIGIDISQLMIQEAIKRNNSIRIKFLNNDIEEYLNSSNDFYDIVISIATFHHLDMENILRILKTKLNKDGIILILDLYKTRTLFEYFLSVVATICNPFMYLVKRKSLFNTQEEREAWKDHFQYDEYSTINEVEEITHRTLGNVKIRHHLFWRYSLVYVKNEET